MEKPKKSKLNHSVCQVLRTRWGMTQSQLSAAAGITQADLSEMENYEPYGQMDKYRKVAGFFGVSIDAIVRNDFRFIRNIASELPELVYCDMPDTEEKIIGRMGEDFAYETERERLREQRPALSDLILPYYKIKGTSPGYDILSFDEDGVPMCIEVKTSRPNTASFRLTDNELKTAEDYHARGINYIIRNIVEWGTENQRILDMSYREMIATHNIKVSSYWCTPKPNKPEKISGITYFRKLRGMTQAEFAELMDITQTECSLYETGSRKPCVDFYLKASEMLDADIEALISEYDSKAEDNKTPDGAVQKWNTL